MKIGAFTGNIGYLPLVREKREGQTRDEGQSHTQQQTNSENSQEKDGQPNEESPEFSKKLDQAIESFQSDLQTQANGLNASIEGNGPGLKVVLKDGTGGLVRQFSGEEFLKLRQAVSKEGRVSGKILDQKR